MTKADASRFRPTPHHRGTRHRAMLRVQVIDSRGVPIDAMVRDLAPRGVSVAVRGTPPPLADVVQLMLPNGDCLWGMVRWVEGNLAGIELDISSRQVMGDTIALHASRS